jgi:uncharacterized protein (DUF924 family)
MHSGASRALVATPDEVVAFWRALGPDKWFTRDPESDAAIRDRFLATYENGAAGGLSDWEQTAEGALALMAQSALPGSVRN